MIAHSILFVTCLIWYNFYQNGEKWKGGIMFHLIKKFNKKTIGDSALFLERIMAFIVFVAIIAAILSLWEPFLEFWQHRPDSGMERAPSGRADQRRQDHPPCVQICGTAPPVCPARREVDGAPAGDNISPKKDIPAAEDPACHRRCVDVFLMSKTGFLCVFAG